MDEQSLVLVVEDDELTRAFLLDNLAADGFRVAGASGAGEGVRLIEVRQPALVVLDLVLADGSGLARQGLPGSVGVHLHLLTHELQQQAVGEFVSVAVRPRVSP